jgi:hypothetical protein
MSRKSSGRCSSGYRPCHRHYWLDCRPHSPRRPLGTAAAGAFTDAAADASATAVDDLTPPRTFLRRAIFREAAPPAFALGLRRTRRRAYPVLPNDQQLVARGGIVAGTDVAHPAIADIKSFDNGEAKGPGTLDG